MSIQSIILISGYARSGKDTLANALTERLAHREPVRVKFADPLKRAVQLVLNDLGLGHIDAFTEDEELKKILRPLMVEVGKCARTIDKDVFVRAAWRDISDLFQNGKSVVIVPDLRYSNEIERFKEWAQVCCWNVVHLRICRVGNQAANEEEMHSVCSLPQADAYRTFTNGDFDGIKAWAKELCSNPFLPSQKPWPDLIEAAKRGVECTSGVPYEFVPDARIWTDAAPYIPPTKPGVDLDELLKRLEDLENEAATNGALRSLSDERGDKLDERILALERTDGVKARLDDLTKRVEHLEKAPWIDLQNAMLGIRVTLERMDARIKRLEANRHDF